MFLIFADDSRNNSPNIPNMGKLVSIGGIIINAEKSNSILKQINQLCADYNFPPHDEFKWSPGRELWMNNNLVNDKREKFIIDILSILKTNDAISIICVNDTKYKTASGIDSHEKDVTYLFIERISQYLNKHNSKGLLIVDRPSGGRSDEDKFLYDCLVRIENSEGYIIPNHFAHNVISTPSKYSRLLQCADIITGCTTAKVGGENKYSKIIFKHIKQLLHRRTSKIAGYGLKIHPEYIYDNLYHWLIDEEFKYAGFQVCEEYPIYGKPFRNNPYKNKI